jgi:hypothetical protein
VQRTNVGILQTSLQGIGNFTVVVFSPSITITQAQITATWEYSNGIDYDWLPLTENITRVFNNREFTIRLIDAFALDGNTKIIANQNTGYTGDPVVQRTNVGTLQNSLQGTGNFAGSVTSPSITIVVA